VQQLSLCCVQLKPNAEQRMLMRKLVKHFRLKPTGVQLASQAVASQVAGSNDAPAREQLVPEDTLNPMIQRFYWYVGQKALNSHFQVRTTGQYTGLFN